MTPKSVMWSSGGSTAVIAVRPRSLARLVMAHPQTMQLCNLLISGPSGLVRHLLAQRSAEMPLAGWMYEESLNTDGMMADTYRHLVRILILWEVLRCLALPKACTIALKRLKPR